MEPPCLPSPPIDPMELLGRDYPSFHAAVDAVEAALNTLPQSCLPPVHALTSGLYSRRLFMPAGSVIVSKIHRRQHQYVALSGVATVLTADGASRVTAGQSGITEPGTRRLLFIHEDSEWMTFHPTDQTDIESIENDLIIPRHLLEETLTQLLP
ncbi:MAG: hypothetical protein EBS21_02485 [Sphingomonadaceae bacterium]|nr:hypothetical protein [Sphingomonadaceae bacterium]